MCLPDCYFAICALEKISWIAPFVEVWTKVLWKICVCSRFFVLSNARAKKGNLVMEFSHFPNLSKVLKDM